MNLQETIKRLGEKARESHKEKYFGDEADYSFRRHVLILLEGLQKKKRKMSKYNLHVSKEMKAGKSMQEATKTWKKILDSKSKFGDIFPKE